VAYRVVNFLVPTLPSLLAHSSLAPMLDEHAAATHGARKTKPGAA
jgi:hypothetical protein